METNLYISLLTAIRNSHTARGTFSERKCFLQQINAVCTV